MSSRPEATNDSKKSFATRVYPRGSHRRAGVFLTRARGNSRWSSARRAGGQAFTFPGFAAAKPNLLAGLDGAAKEPSGTPSGTVFVGVSGVSGVARRGGERADEAVVAVVDENAAVLFDGARARRLRLRRSERRLSEEDKSDEDKSEEESDEDDEDG